MAETPTWRIAGDWFDNCSCAVACPCTFAEPPDNGYCKSVLFWHIVEGRYGDVVLDDISFVRVGRWEGDLWAGNAYGGGGMYIDERADDDQMQAVLTILGGKVGGFPALWASMFPDGRKVLGVERAKISYEIAPDQSHWGVEIAGKIKAWRRRWSGPPAIPANIPG